MMRLAVEESQREVDELERQTLDCRTPAPMLVETLDLTGHSQPLVEPLPVETRVATVESPAPLPDSAIANDISSLIPAPIGEVSDAPSREELLERGWAALPESSEFPRLRRRLKKLAPTANDLRIAITKISM